MTSESKMRKVSKKLHHGRGGSWLKEFRKGIKRLSFYTASQRRQDKKINIDEND